MRASITTVVTSQLVWPLVSLEDGHGAGRRPASVSVRVRVHRDTLRYPGLANTTLPQVILVDIVITPFPTQRAVAMATIGSATSIQIS